MGKKINNPKLLKKSIGPSQSMLSVFNKFANKITQSRRKKIQKVGDTKQRLMQSKKTNKMIKISKRTSKFSLLQDDQNLPKGLTHRGKNINELKQFNDMNFGSDVDDEQFEKIHENLNFTGFDEQEEKPIQEGRPKSKNQVYKQIIEKSKLHKHLRQELYEQNFNKAVQLDEQFPQFTNNLKFRNRDSNVRQKLDANIDHDFQKLANQLKEDEKVVSNKVIQKNEKYTDKIRKKKTQQLNELMKDSSSEEADIRGWVKNLNEGSEQQQELEEDELDEVQLSSDEQGQDGQQEYQQIQLSDQQIQPSQQQEKTPSKTIEKGKNKNRKK